MINSRWLHKKTSEKSIRKHLFAATLTYMMCVGSITFFGAVLWQGYMSKNNAISSVHTSIDAVENSILRVAWQVNDEGMQTILQSLSAHPNIDYVQYVDNYMNHEASVEKISSLEEAKCTPVIRINYEGKNYLGERLDSGELIICVHVGNDRILPLIIAGLGTILIVLVGALGPTAISTKLLVDPIVRLTEKLKKGEKLTTFDYYRSDSNRGDEIDTLHYELASRTSRLHVERTLSSEIFANIPAAIAVCDENYEILRTNPQFVEQFGSPSQILTGTDLRSIIPHDALKKSGNKDASWSRGDKHWESNLFSINSDISQNRIAFLARDITEKVRLDMERQQHQKVAALGTLSGGIAHDFNNLLSVVIGATEMMQMEDITEAERGRLLGEVEASALHAKSLTSQLLAFARRSELKREIVPLGTLIQSAVTLANRMIGSMHTLNVNILKDGMIHTDSSALQSCILNLILNARDAMPDGGEIEINCDVDHNKGSLEGAITGIIEVKNRGDIIPAEILSRLTEPFFTTKENGKGTGLGLSMVEGFVRQEKGTLNITSEEENGTIVTIYLALEEGVPLAEEKLQKSQTKGAQAPIKKSVLLIEDTEIVKKITIKMIESLGHTVEAYSSLQELEEVPNIHRRHWDFILCDYALQGHNGLDVLKYLRGHDIKTKFVILSGYLEDSVVKDLMEAGASGTFEKPIRLTELKKLIDEK